MPILTSYFNYMDDPRSGNAHHRQITLQTFALFV